MRIDYVLLNPTGNVTLLVKTPVAEEEQPVVAAKLMEREPLTEQVGFLSPGDGESDLGLRMAGGEFCGNATMSAAAVFALERKLEEAVVCVRVSGAEKPVKTEIGPRTEKGLQGRVEMPKPLATKRLEIDPGDEKVPGDPGERIPERISAVLVRFQGISHVILEEEPERESAERLAKLLCRRLKADALGLMFCDRESERLTPLVYVPTAGTLCWESSCASGTTAVGAWLASKTEGKGQWRFHEPGGTLTVSADENGSLFLAGYVALLKQESIEL